MEELFGEEKKIFVYNLDENKVLFEKNETEKTEVASLTKIMTAWIAVEKVPLDQKIIITPEMLEGLEEFAVVGLVSGQEITAEELLFATLLPSAGDAAQALAVAASGSIEKFVEEMNKHATELELSNTSFSNVVGFDEENFSSAEDIAKILESALENPEFKKAFETFEFYSPSLDKTLKKTFQGGEIIRGGKTGFTYAAGRCLASTAEINGANLLVVDLNEDWQSNDHVENTLKIYDFYQKNYSLIPILGSGDEIVNIPVEDSETKNLKISADETVTKFLKNETEFFSKFEGVEKIDNKFSVGDFLGTFTVETDTETLYQKDFFLEEEIEFYPYALWNSLVGAAIFLFAVFGVFLFKKKRRKFSCS